MLQLKGRLHCWGHLAGIPSLCLVGRGDRGLALHVWGFPHPCSHSASWHGQFQIQPLLQDLQAKRALPYPASQYQAFLHGSPGEAAN